MERIELLPCPFCGVVPKTFSSDHCPAGKWGAVVCCCIGPEVRTHYQVDGWQDEAAEEWNKRAALQPKEVPDYEAAAREIVNMFVTSIDNPESDVPEVSAILRKHFPQQ